MILDLRAFVDETLDITMATGRVLHIPKASQKMVIEIMKLKTIDESTPAEEAERALNKLTGDILNSNIDGVIIASESIAELSEQMKLAIVDAYTRFIKKIQSNPI